MVNGTRVLVDGMREGTVIDSYGGPPVDYEESVRVRFDDGGTDWISNALTEASDRWPPRIVQITA